MKTEQPVKVDDWADEIFGSSEPLSAKKARRVYHASLLLEFQDNIK